MEKQSLEISARSVEEAIQQGIQELDVDIDAVEIDVVTKGRPGILGIGAEPARVRLTVRLENDEANPAKEILEKLLDYMGVSATVYLTPRESDGVVNLEILGEDSGVLIGRHGHTLDDIQTILSLLLNRRLEERIPIQIDVESYKEKRREKLEALAWRIARRVHDQRQSVSLEPMSPAERRLIHVALADHPRVLTESTGTGVNRQVVIYPKREEDWG